MSTASFWLLPIMKKVSDRLMQLCGLLSNDGEIKMQLDFYKSKARSFWVKNSRSPGQEKENVNSFWSCFGILKLIIILSNFQHLKLASSLPTSCHWLAGKLQVPAGWQGRSKFQMLKIILDYNELRIPKQVQELLTWHYDLQLLMNSFINMCILSIWVW